jgi:hypothetical protein
MKKSWWAFASLTVGPMFAGIALAQSAGPNSIQQPSFIQQNEAVAFAGADPAAPGNVPPAPAVPKTPAAPSEPPPAPPATVAQAAPAEQPAQSGGVIYMEHPLLPPSKDETPLHSRINPDDCFPLRFYEANWDVFYGVPEPEQPEPERRALPQPWSSPPFPGHEWQGYPLVGVPADTSEGLLMKAIDGGPHADYFKEWKINLDGWATASGNFSNAKQTNLPESYWIVPNAFELDQFVFRAARQVDTVQTDHIDWGFRSLILYGIDYREMVAGGWWPGYQQLLLENELYGTDLTEQYFELYIPRVFEGMVIRAGRWIACPDIETQYSPDNYLGSHSLLFTYDTYTQSGVMFTMKLNMNVMVQAAIESGTDMAPWYKGATPTLFAGLRWESTEGKDAVYTCLNNYNSAEFRHFIQGGPGGFQPSGHDNYNYIVSTWEHKFNDYVHTATEGYYMWQHDAEVGGTPSLGPVMDYGGGGGNGTLLPGWSYAYGLLNYTEFKTSENNYFCLRNEWWEDTRGMRSGFAGVYTSHTVGFSHNFNSCLQVRPEVGYYRNWTQPAFDNGTLQGLWQYGFDVTYHF